MLVAQMPKSKLFVALTTAQYIILWRFCIIILNNLSCSIYKNETAYNILFVITNN